MRLAVLLLVAVFSGGCLGSIDFGVGETVCPPDVRQAAARAFVVYPPAATMDPSPAENPFLEIYALPGQSVIAQAAWSNVGGSVQVNFDGPDGDTTQTRDTWTRIATAAEEGNVTLGLVGAPFAYDVTYVLQLLVTGCQSG